MKLEDFLGYYYGVVIYDNPNNNVALEFPTAMPKRSQVRLTSEQFATIVALFETHREAIEDWIKAFPSDRMFFDDYCYCAPMPIEEYKQGLELIKKWTEQNDTIFDKAIKWLGKKIPNLFIRGEIP
jgi:hypothetical protein